MYDTLVGGRKTGDKTSVIDEIDFEIELLRKDSINVMYIISLLKNLNSKEKSFAKDVEFILRTMESVPSLRNKRELLERFIQENREILTVDSKEDIEDGLAEFLKREKEKAIQDMIIEEELKADVVNSIIDKCEFTEKAADYTDIKESFIKKPSVLKLKPRIEIIQHKIETILDKFNFFGA